MKKMSIKFYGVLIIKFYKNLPGLLVFFSLMFAVLTCHPTRTRFHLYRLLVFSLRLISWTVYVSDKEILYSFKSLPFFFCLSQLFKIN